VALLVPAAAQAAPTELPTVDRTLNAAGTTSDSCTKANGTGTDTTTYTAPMSGYLNARLKAASGDWDLVLRDAQSGLNVAASQSFGSDELSQIWVKPGQQITAIACRHSGADTASLGLTLVDVKPPAPLGQASLLRVHGTQQQFQALDRLGLDVTENAHGDWNDVLVAGSKQLDAVQALHLPFETRIANMNTYAAANTAADAAAGGPSPLPSGRTTYRTYDDIQSELKQIAAAHSDIVRPVTIGKSFQGRDINGLEIADDVNGNDGRPVFFLVALHHAREWPSAEAAMEYAHMLVDQQSDPHIASLLAHERTVIVPVVNPDGYISSRSAADPADTIRDLNGGTEVDPTGGTLPPSTVESVAPPGGITAYRRKNCDGEIGDGNVPCELQYGVDPNRNYGNLWGGAGASPDPTSQSYHGPGPRSEPEVQAVWNYARTHQVTTLITLHNVAALVLRPPGLHDGGKAPDEKRLKDIGDAMANATGYTSEFGFQLYDTAGTTEDDTYAAQGGYGYTIEMGPENGAFHMPYQTGVVDEWTGNNPKDQGRGGLREALLIAGDAAANTADHAVLRGTAPAGATLRVKRDFQTKTSKWCALGADPAVNVNTPLSELLGCPGGLQDPKTLDDTVETTTTVPADGHFEWHMNQSTRPFVGGGAVEEKLSDTSSRTDTFTGGGPGSTPGSSEDKPFTITDDDHADQVKVDVSWDTPEDYDLEVYKGKPDDPNPQQVGTSGNSAGTPEEVILDHPASGDYFLRVVNFTAAVGPWTATVKRFTTTSTTTTGHKEAYTLTCEQGGNVVASQQLTIDRGQVVDLDPCGGSDSGTPSTGGGGSSGGGGGGGTSGGGTGSGTDDGSAGAGSGGSAGSSAGAQAPASVGAVLPLGAKASSGATAKPRSTAKSKAKRIRACKTKAKKIRSRSKRARALARCR
jgi:hypothetical protein